MRTCCLLPVLLLTAVGCSRERPPTAAAPKAPAVVGTAVFRDGRGQSIRAEYCGNDTVQLTLVDGAVKVLGVARSGSGARYASDREEWWEHHGEARYSVDGKLVFTGKQVP